MPNKKIFLVTIVFLFVLSLSPCVRTASKAPKGAEGTPAASSEPTFPVPGVTDDVFGQLSSFATQTAIALGGGPVTTEEAYPSPEQPTGEGEVSATPEPEKPTQAPSGGEQAQPKNTYKPKAREVPKTYTLHKGEHPYCIARRFNVNPATMLQLSGLSAGGSYSTGTVLKIPQSGSFPGKRSLLNHPTTYTVESGDTLYSIACLFGDVWPEDIAEANGLKVGASLQAGQKLYIP